MAFDTTYMAGRSPTLYLVAFDAPEQVMEITLACLQRSPKGRPYRTLRYQNVTGDEHNALISSGSPYRHFAQFFFEKRPHIEAPLRI